jgi:hypothetical protein
MPIVIDMRTPSLVLELTDIQTGCLLDEVGFVDAESHQLLELLGMEEANFEGMSYDMSAEDLTSIRQEFKSKKILLGAGAGQLRARGGWDDLPYKLHTNRELLLMLKGEKPLAVFHDAHPWQSHELRELCERFEPYVTEGRFIKREYVDESFLEKHQSMKWVFFALPAEAWRIDAYILLKQTAKLSGWNDGFERLEGSLLGYTDEQNTIHLSKNCS